MAVSTDRDGAPVTVAGRRRTCRIGTALFALAAVLALTAIPVTAAAETKPAEYEFHAADLLDGGTDEIVGEPMTLVLEGTATEGDTVRIAIEEDEQDAFEITGVTDETDAIGIAVDHTTDAIEIELTDLGGDGTVTGAELEIAVNLRASDAVASGAAEYDATSVATVDDGETNVELKSERMITVSIVEAGEIGFTAEEIDEQADLGFLPLVKLDTFVFTFDSEEVRVDDGESINISVNPNTIKTRDTDGFLIEDVWEESTSDRNISSIDISTSNQANVLDDSIDQFTITINTSDGDPKLISSESIAVNIEVLIDKESMKYAANRYHDADFLEIDVEGENNTYLTSNDDIHTESPLYVDIYPSEVDGFALDGPEAGAEIAIGENRTVGIDTARDRFGNEIRRPTIEATLAGTGDEYRNDEIEFDTAEREGPVLGREGEIQPRLGVFDLTLEVTDIEGPETHANGAVTATIENIAIYPDDVRVSNVGASNDFDVDGGNVELTVGLGVLSDEIDRVDIELRRVRGEGTIAIDRTEGAPTDTDLWKDTEYAGDGEMRPENAWVIERDLIAGDFDENGTRTYVLKADTADRYEVTADVMPYEDRLVANETEVGTSTVGAHDATRGTAEVVATGPIEAVSGVSVRTEHEFVGVEQNGGKDVVVDLGTFLDANGNVVSETTETVTVGIGNETIEDGIGTGSVTAEISPTANEPVATVALDPTAIDATAVETGTNATVAVEFEDGQQRNATDLTLVHRVSEPDGDGWHAGSIPQPATLYVDADGARDLVQWNPTTERYESPAATATSDVLERHRIDAKDLHRGFYFRSTDGGARLGFDFVTDDETTSNETNVSGTVELDKGWHLGSSNYDISEHARRGLAEDVNWTDYGFGKSDDAFVVRNSTDDRIHDRTNGIDIDGTTVAIEHDETYWIRIRNDDESSLIRGIVSPTFTESDGVQGEEIEG